MLVKSTEDKTNQMLPQVFTKKDLITKANKRGIPKYYILRKNELHWIQQQDITKEPVIKMNDCKKVLNWIFGTLPIESLKPQDVTTCFKWISLGLSVTRKGQIIVPWNRKMKYCRKSVIYSPGRDYLYFFLHDDSYSLYCTRTVVRYTARDQ